MTAVSAHVRSESHALCLTHFAVEWNATVAGERCEHYYSRDDPEGDMHPIWNVSEVATVKVCSIAGSWLSAADHAPAEGLRPLG